eukprot:2165329-Amphidinium_carterae.2
MHRSGKKIDLERKLQVVVSPNHEFAWISAHQTQLSANTNTKNRWHHAEYWRGNHEADARAMKLWYVGREPHHL